MDIQEIAQKGSGEHYIDSARQIAVGMGVTDVKDTLAEFEDQITQLSRLTPTDELNIHILVEQAAYELRQHKPEKALTFVLAGLRKNINCLPNFTYQINEIIQTSHMIVSFHLQSFRNTSTMILVL